MLRGLGVSIALPWMESLTAAGEPAVAGAAATAPPLRLPGAIGSPATPIATV